MNNQWVAYTGDNETGPICLDHDCHHILETSFNYVTWQVRDNVSLDARLNMSFHCLVNHEPYLSTELVRSKAKLAVQLANIARKDTNLTVGRPKCR